MAIPHPLNQDPSDPLEVANRQIAAIAELERCPAWSGYIVPRMKERERKHAEASVTASTVEERERERLLCLQIRDMLRFVEEDKRGALNTIEQEKKARAARRPG